MQTLTNLFTTPPYVTDLFTLTFWVQLAVILVLVSVVAVVLELIFE